MKKIKKMYTDFYVHTLNRYGIRKEAQEFPMMVVLSITYVCNAKCPSCPYTNSEIRNSYEKALYIREDTFKIIADQCGEYGAYIRFTGGGEPLIHPKAVELAEYAKKVGARVSIITNGSLLDKEKSYRLLKANVDMIEISVDAADKKTYESVRKGLSWEILLENVANFVKMRNEMKSSTKIIVSAINQEGVDIDEVEKFWRDKVDHVQLRKYLTWGFLNPEKSQDPLPYLPDEAPCPWLFERLNIDTYGNVSMCGYDIAFSTHLGNVHEKSIKEIWKGEEFQKLRKLHLEGRMNEIELCRTCTDRKYRTWTYNFYKLVEIAEENRKKKIEDQR
ncbi:radical SAM protein [Thermosipho ferrireducens]|uniref:Radical SAM protein n=1 Tax=Thermosipho ferrireducens TaxID=2571116 RepID=A0ABX7S9R9_9BACT|nr:radical SAM protein [Thermosipho ferrireducens]QTA38630.1 radical SAM protein [Thermosipho ferrireducens]